MPTLTLARGAPAVSSARTNITSACLKDRAVAIKSEVAALVAARSALSLAVIEGDAEAIAAQAAIDAKRSTLLSELETVEAAIPEVSQRERTQTPFSPRDVERLKRQLALMVGDRRNSLVFNLQHGSLRDNRPNEIVDALAYIEPLAIARELVTPSVRREQIYWNHNASATEVDGARRKQAQANAERNKTIERLARELVAATELPPLPPEIAKLQS
jgi:hypothetical protein